MTELTQPGPGGSANLRSLGWIIAAAVAGLAVYFYGTYAIKYFTWNEAVWGPYYWPKRSSLIFHIGGGSLALFAGLWQLFSGLTRRHMKVHPLTGKLYLLGVVVGSAAAYSMVPSAIAFGWSYAMGLAGLASAWLLVTGMAFYAIRRRNIDQHREWMIRSYVVTFAFVTFRLISEIFPSAALGTTDPEWFGTLLWVSWVAPLMIAEAVIQGRKI